MQFVRVLKLIPRDKFQIANKICTTPYTLAEPYNKPQFEGNTLRRPPQSARSASPIGTVNEFKPTDKPIDRGQTIEHYQLGPRKFAYVRKYDDRLTVHIREFFLPKAFQSIPPEKITMEHLRPSNHGVILSPDQWREFKAVIERLDKDMETASKQQQQPPQPPASAPQNK